MATGRHFGFAFLPRILVWSVVASSPSRRLPGRARLPPGPDRTGCRHGRAQGAASISPSTTGMFLQNRSQSDIVKLPLSSR